MVTVLNFCKSLRTTNLDDYLNIRLALTCLKPTPNHFLAQDYEVVNGSEKDEMWEKEIDDMLSADAGAKTS